MRIGLNFCLRSANLDGRKAGSATFDPSGGPGSVGKMSETNSLTAQRQAFLSTEVARPGEKRLAWAVVAVSLVAFAFGLPFVRMPLARIPAFIPSYEAALWINDTITAML